MRTLWRGLPLRNILPVFVTFLTLSAFGQIRVYDLPNGGHTGKYWKVWENNGQTFLFPLPGFYPRDPSVIPVYEVDGSRNIYLFAGDAATDEDLGAAYDYLIEKLSEYSYSRTEMESSEEESESFGPQAYSYGTNNLWLEIISAEVTLQTNVAALLTVHSPVAGTFDIFFRTNIAPSNSWFWIARGLPNQTNFNIAGLPADGGGFFTAGTTNGLDANGVTEAYRILVGGDETLANDFDHDSLPDAWEINFFGDLAQSGEGDFDADGLYDYGAYTNRSDPNNIQSMLNFPTYRVSSSTVFGKLTLLGGIPAYIAVLVNDTNRADAGWALFNSTNVPVNLSGGDGKYSVQIGLRGRAIGAAEAWLGTQLILDTVPPILRITNLPAGTVTQPLLQLQGWANEPLNRVVYDLTNSAGVLTNQIGYITGQFADTNLLQFTTNYFQYYDLPLAEGTNRIGLHATDLAGNTTTTNIAVILDYGAETSIPGLTLLWPLDGTQIAGDTFTVQAQGDNPTVTVEASVVDGSGNTNTVSGLVERSGLIWAKGLTLGSGTNTLVLKATSAAGHTSTISATIVRSALTVTMNPLPTNQVNSSLVNATGTVSDASAEVWVNEIQAAVDTNGTWHAADVPVSPSGTAIFDVEVYNPPPPGSQFGPSGTADASQVFEEAQPPRVVLVSYSARFPRESEWHATCDPGDPMTQWDNQVTWSRDVGGAHHYSAHGDFVNPPVDGTEPLIAGDDAIRPPWEQADVSVATSWQQACLASADSWEYQVETRLVIEPGGQQPIGETATYLVRARALEMARPSAIPGHVGLDYLISGAGTNYTGTIPLSPESLVLNGAPLISTGETNADGSTWGWTPVRAHAGAQPEVRLAATQVQQYNDQTFDVKVSVLSLKLSVNDIPLESGKVATNATFIVGQVLRFSTNELHLPQGVQSKTAQWTFEGHFLNDSNQPCADCSVNYTANAAKLTNEITSAWWVSGGTNPPVTYTARLTETLTLSNGSTVIVSGKGLFSMLRPHARIDVQTGTPSFDTNLIYGMGPSGPLYTLGLHYGMPTISGTNTPGIVLSNYFFLPPEYSGSVQFVQVIDSYLIRYQTNTPVGSWIRAQGSGLDTSYPYPTIISSNRMEDSPGFDINGPPFCESKRMSVSNSFQTWLEFRPAVSGDAHWVPLRKVAWTFGGEGILVGTNCQPSDWIGTNFISTPNPVDVETETYAHWTNIVVTPLHYDPE